jgi:thiamine monophosphate kinase
MHPALSAFATACRAAGERHAASPAEEDFTLPGGYDPSGASQRYMTLADYALASSEDYSLLFTLPPDAGQAQLPEACVCLGSVRPAVDGCTYCDEHGVWHALASVGWQHR